MSTPHVTPLKVRFNELDPYGHVNHAQYVSYFEHARTEALESIGLPMDQMAAKGVQVVVMEMTVAYKLPAVAGDELEIDTWISQLRRASTIWEQRIRRGDELCVTLNVRAGVTDTNGRPMRPPTWLFDSLEALTLSPGPEAESRS